MTTKRIGLVLIAVLAFYSVYLNWQLSRARDRDLAARVALQGKVLVDAGWLKGVEGSKADLEQLVPDLREQLAAAKKAKATTAIASHWDGHGAAVAVPCTVVMGSPAGDMTPTSSPSAPATGQPETPPSVAVTPHVRIDDAVALDDAGGIFVARQVSARLAVGQKWASEWAPVEADPGSTTAVAPEVERAWRAWRNPPRPPKEIRIGVGFPGPTVRVGATLPFWPRIGLWGDVAAPVNATGEFSAAAGVAVRF